MFALTIILGNQPTLFADVGQFKEAGGLHEQCW